MSRQETNSGFQTTHWSMVAGVAQDPSLLEALLQSYWGPIYAYIRRSGPSRDQAADLTQEFIAQVVLERDLFSRADPARGRFRTLLKSSLRNFLIDQHRRATARGRQPDRPALGGDALDRLEPAASDKPAVAFDRQWAATILSIALDRLATDCAACGQQTHWAVFESAVLHPTLGQSQPVPLESLAAGLSLSGPQQASSMVNTVRRKFRRILREVVAETVAGPGAADAELGDLRRLLGL
jgi:DNA-directed RNA polymerase specialized sigma24 family protein